MLAGASLQNNLLSERGLIKSNPDKTKTDISLMHASCTYGFVHSHPATYLGIFDKHNGASY
jgi:hypothetical protein